MDNKEDLVLIPGLLHTEQLWKYQIIELSDVANIHVGNTRAGDESMGAMAERILADSPAKFSLAGLSMGGYIALEIIKRAPERVNRLALLNTQAQTDNQARADMRQQTVSASRHGKFIGASRMLIKRILSEQSYQNSDLVKIIQDMAQEVGLDLFLAQQTAIINRDDKMDLLPHITVPTLVIMGDEDDIIPSGTNEAMVKCLPNVTFKILENCGHLAPLEQPDATNTLLKQWLQR